MRYLLLCLLLLSLGAVKAQLWQPIGGSASGPVRCLYADTAAGLLYVGGDFGTIGGLPAYQVANRTASNAMPVIPVPTCYSTHCAIP